MSHSKDDFTTPLRIIRYFNGYLEMINTDSVEKLLQHSNIDPNNLIILSIVGPQRSGKSFLLNLFLNYLKADGQGDWILPFIKKEDPKPLTGFQWNTSVGDQTFEHGIYIWPIPFKMTKSNGEYVSILLLDYVKVDETPEYGPMEELLCCLCSTVVDNQMSIFRPDTLKMLSTLHANSHSLNSQISICTNVSFLIRDFCSSNNFSHGWGDKAKRYIEKSINDYHNEEIQETYQQLELKTAFLLKKPETIPAMSEKCISVLDRDMTRQLKNLVSKLLDADELPIKAIGSNGLHQYFNVCLEIVNQIERMRHPFLSGSNNGINPTPHQLDLSSDFEMEDLSGNNSAENRYNNNRMESTELDTSNQQIHSVPTQLPDEQLQLSVGSNFHAEDNLQEPVTFSKISPQQLRSEFSEQAGWRFGTHNSISPPSAQTQIYENETSKTTSNLKQNEKGATSSPCFSDDIQKQEKPFGVSSSISNNIPSAAMDEEVQGTVLKIKDSYDKNMKNYLGTSLTEAHRIQTEECCKQLQIFLSNLDLGEPKKRDYVRQLEMSLTLQHNKMKVELKKQKESLAHTNSNSQCKIASEMKQSEIVTLSVNKDNVDAAQAKKLQIHEDKHLNLEEPMDTDDSQTHQNFVPDLIKKLELKYDELMKRVFEKSLMPTAEAIQSTHKQAMGAIMKDLKNISKQEGLNYEEINKPIESYLSAKLTLFNNEVSRRGLDTMKLVEKVHDEIQQQLIRNLCQWVGDFTWTLKKKQMASIFYDQLFQNALRPMISRVPLKNHSEFKERVKKKAKHFEVELQCLEQCLQSYEYYMNRQFTLYRCLSEEKYSECHQTAITQCKEKPKDEMFLKYLVEGLNCFNKRFSERNKKIHQYEDSLAQQLFSRVYNFYDEIMKALLKEKMYTLNDLEQLHRKIVDEECIQAFKNACNFRPESGMPDYNKKLKNDLDKRFQSFMDSNKLKIEKLKMSVSKAISDCRKEYNDKMDAAFPRNGASLDPLTLKKLHDSNSSDVCKLLEFNLHKLEESIPIETSVETLQRQIHLDWEEVCKSNNKKIKKEEEAEKDKEKEIKKMEAEEILRQNKIKTDKQKTRKEHISSATSQVDAGRINVSTSSSAKTPSPTGSQRKSSTPTKRGESPRTDIDPNRELPPIAIEFGLENTRVGCIIDNYLNTISNPWGTRVTSNKLGITYEDKIVIGEEVTSRQNVRIKYCLNKILTDEKNVPYHWISNELDQMVKKAFLIGLFLSKMKSEVEEALQGRWKTAVITVPLWYTSVQRQKTKDAAQIAGFDKVHLINETTAAALAFFSDPVRQKVNGNHVLVTVASDPHFDAAVYEYRYGEVKMVSSWGDCHCSQQSTSSLKKLARQASSWVNSVVNTLKSSKDSPHDNIRQLFRGGVGQSKGYINESIFIDSGCYNNLTNSLKNVTEHYGRPLSSSSDLILFGAAKYAESTRSNDFGKLVKDMAIYSFQRTVPKGPPKIIFESYQPLIKTEIPCEHTISLQPKGQPRLEIHVVSGVNDFPVGTLILHRPQQPVQEIQARFLLNNEGIFRAQVYYFNDCQTKITMNAEWISSNLGDTEKAEYASLVDLLKKDKKKEFLKKSKLELQSLSHEIESKIQGVSSAIGKNLLRKEVAEAEAIVQHSNSTQDKINAKITTLKKLKVMYMK